MMLGRLDNLGYFAPLSAAPVTGKYTHVVAGSNNVFLFYNATTGAAATAKLSAPANNYISLQTITSLSSGWTNIVAGVNNVLLFFKSTPGNAMSAQLDAAGNVTILHNPLWGADLGWTSITAGFKNKTLLFYHSPTGTIATGTLDQNGNYVSFGSGSGFSTGWTHIVGP
jgi:glucan-binding YG repeat protein